MSVSSELGLQKTEVLRSGPNLQLLAGERPLRQLHQQFANQISRFRIIFELESQ